MDDIINELIRIEGIAKNITADIELSRKDLPNRVAARRAEIEAGLAAEFKEKSARLEEECFSEAREAVLRIQADAQEQFSRLEEACHNNQDKWADEIFELIIEN